MVNIQLDEATANMLMAEAVQAGMTVSEYVRRLIGAERLLPRESWADLERAILAHTSPGPSLPDDFSRADIYCDRD